LASGAAPSAVMDDWAAELAAFVRRRQPALLYPRGVGASPTP
jgi:hypothetical protein